MYYNSRKIRIWPIAMTILLLAGFLISQPGLPQNVSAKTIFQSVGQDTISFSHAMVPFTPPEDSCVDRVEFQLTAGANDIDIVIYDEVTEIEGQRFNVANKLAEMLDQFSATDGSVSFQLPNPLRLTQDADVYIAVSTQPSALAANAATSEGDLSYVSYDGTNWRESQLAFNIQLQTKACGADVPVGPAPANTPFVPTPTPTPLPTSTTIPTTAPDEPTYTPTAAVAVEAVCEALSARMQVAASSLGRDLDRGLESSLDREGQAIPLWSEPLAPERSSDILRKQSLSDFYLVLSSGQLQRVDLGQRAADPAKLDMPTQVEPNTTGMLLLPDGDPAANFAISIYEVDSENNVYGNPIFIGQTDGDGLLGIYLISGKYLLRVEPPLKDADGLPVDGIQMLEHLFEVDSAIGETELGELTLLATTKIIQGQIVHTDGTLISETRVDAFNANTGQNVYTYPDSNGTFEFNVGGGLWQLSLLPAVGVTWVPVDARQDVQFQRNETAETVEELVFSVKPADAIMIGRVIGPDGQPLTSDTLDVFGLNFNVRVDVFDTVAKRLTFGFVDATGAFTIPLSTGLYEGSVWIDNALYPQFTRAFLDDLVQVTTGTVNVGPIRLGTNDSILKGVVSNSDGEPVPNMSVDIWQESGQSRSGTTDENGLYEMAVSSGKWWVRPAPQDYQSYLFTGRTQQVTLNATAPAQADFSLEPSTGQLSGTVVDDQDRLLGEIDGYVYIRRSGDTKTLMSVRLENGRFTAKIPYGDLRVGMFLGPDSPYVLPEEAVPSGVPEMLTASVMATANLDDLFNLSLANRDQAAFIQSAASDLSVKLQVIAATAQVQGELQEPDGTPVTGIAGDVIAVEQGRVENWKRSAINPADGSYSLSLVAGTWDLVYELAVNENDKTIAQNPERPATVIAEANTTVTQNLTITKQVLVAKGSVVDENGLPIPNASVLIRLNYYEGNVRSDESGLFSVYVPPNLEAEVEAALTDGKHHAAKKGKPPRSSSSNKPRQFNQVPDLLSSKVSVIVIDDVPSGDVPEIRVVLRSANAYLTGQVLGLDQQPVSGAKVSGVNLKDAQVFTIDTDANGCFAAPVKTEGEYEWQITARYQDGDGIMMESQFTMTGDETGDGTALSSQLQSASASPLAVANLPADSGIVMQYKGTIPQPETHTFAVAAGWSHTLPDGFTIEIAPNAINTNGTEVRIQITPKSMLNETYFHSVVKYGYQISLSDSNGRAILGEFRSNVLIKLDYEEDSIANEEELMVAREAGDEWVKERQIFQNQEDNFFSVSIQQPGVYAVLLPNTIRELSGDVPLPSLVQDGLNGGVEANMALIEVDEQAIWTIRVTNAGDQPAQDVVLTAQLPSGTQIAKRSLADGWTEQEARIYHLTLGSLGVDESVSKLFAVTLLADSRLTTILEPHVVLQSPSSEGDTNISAGSGNNIDVNLAPTSSQEEEENIEHHIYLPVITR